MTEQQFTTEELNSEEWKAVPGYNGLYEASSLGRVKNLRSDSFIALSPSRGYLHVSLLKDGKKKRFRVNRLIAFTFLGFPETPSDWDVDHIDGVKTNNRIQNLEWLTKQEHRKRTIEKNQHLRGEKHPNSKHSEEVIAQIKWLMGEDHSMVKLAAQFNCTIGFLESIKYSSAHSHIPWLRPAVKASRPDTRERARQQMLALWQDKEYKALQSNSHKGRTLSHSQRRRLSDALKRHWKNKKNAP